MEVVLRDYQIRALEKLHNEIQCKNILLLQAATGAGKTVIIVRLINRYIQDHPTRTFLILMHKQELVSQFVKAFEKFSDVHKEDIGIACSSYSPTVNLFKRITIASVQTLYNRMNEFPGADLVVIDETHRVSANEDDSQYSALLSTLRANRPDHRVIGVTATAMRLGHGYIYGDSCRPGKTNFFPELTHRITYQELLDGGYLMKLTGRIASDKSITDDLKSVAVNGDYNLGQLGDVMTKAIHIQSAVDGFEQYGSHHQSVCVFACTIAHCEALVDAFISRGYSAVSIHSKLSPIERESNLAAWQSGEVRLAVSVNILVEGFDFPALSCLVFCRPTKSATLFIQAVGRILRKAEGKEEALLIDLTDNTRTFGLDLDKPMFKVPGESSGEAPYKICPGDKHDGTVCGQSVHASLKYCPGCGYEFPVDEAIEAKIGKLEKVEFNKVPEPEEYTVTHVEYYPHDSRATGKKLIKVEYQCGMMLRFHEWVCLPDYYSGYAVDKARDWWEDRSDEPFPDSVDEFMFLEDTLIKPASVVVVKEGKYYKVKKCKFVEHGDLYEEEFEILERVVEGDDVPF